jgi:hypothetical protein
MYYQLIPHKVCILLLHIMEFNGENHLIILNRDIWQQIFSYCEIEIVFIMSFVSVEYGVIAENFYKHQNKKSPLNLCNYGATYNNIDLIRLGIKLHHTNRHITRIAAENNYLEILKWAQHYIIPYSWHIACNFALWNGHVKILRWAYEDRGMWNDLIWDVCITRGYLEILQWAYTVKPNNKIIFRNIDMAIYNNHLEIVKWAIDKGYVLDEGDLETIVKHNRTEILSWLRIQDPHWNERLYTQALARHKSGN